MSSNVYYGVKDAEFNLSFVETKWLNLYETLAQLKINSNSSSITLNPENLIYPNELVLSENTNNIIDILLLAKYTDKCGNLKLRSILLSQLITNNNNSELSASLSSLKSNRFLILSLPKDSYFWSRCEAHLIPSYALRVGFDHIANQFSYIGRMRVGPTSASISSPPRSSASKSPATLSGLIGTITNLYEYIPAIVLQLHDLSYSNDKKLFNNINQSSPPSSPRHHEYFNHNNAASSASLSNESFWSRLRSAIKNNASSNEFNFNYLLWNNYEVLCLRKQPLKLKQSSILKLKSIEESTFADIVNNHANPIDFNQISSTSINKSLRSLPNSIRQLVWPSYLERGQCIVKNSKMRSANGTYELEITSKGLMMLSKVSGLSEFVNLTDNYNSNNILRQFSMYEKNVESLVVTESGVFITFDNNQAMRKPSQLYNHLKRKFYANFNAAFILELSDSGYLRILFQETTSSNYEDIQKVSPRILNVVNLNEYFISLNNQDHDHPKPTSKEYQSNFSIVNPNDIENSKDVPSVEINVKLVASVNGLRNLMRGAMAGIKLLFQSITRRMRPHLLN